MYTTSKKSSMGMERPLEAMAARGNPNRFCLMASWLERSGLARK
jgi:hypothetical protein